MSAQSYDLGQNLQRESDRDLLKHCLNRMDSAGITGWALEFGVGSGDSLRLIAGYVPVIGFDAFKGLPEDWRPEYRKGMFSEVMEPRGIPGATIVVGWFEDTLPGYEWPEHVSLIHFDADLYQSTRTALLAVGHLLQPGVFCVFDEFHGYEDDFLGSVPGEQQAFREFAEDYPGLTWEVIGHGREQWAIRILTGGAL
jgi:hypothetical protein